VGGERKEKKELNDMLNRDTTISRAYVRAIANRVQTPIEPPGFVPDWEDHPYLFKVYRDVEYFALPLDIPTNLASMAEVYARLQSSALQAPVLTMDDLSLMLYIAHGMSSRRLDINWNGQEQVRATKPLYGRATASGGGLYPTEIYLACGASSPLQPGIYHYGSNNHTLARLYTGDGLSALRAAITQQNVSEQYDHFLIISLNFWKNAFKYNTFSYHVVTQDLGALLFSLRALALALGADFTHLFWFQDEHLNTLLGFETGEESAFAVLPLHLAPSRQAQKERNRHSSDRQGPGFDDQVSRQGKAASLQKKTPGPLVQARAMQRSQKVLQFPVPQQVHRSTLIHNEALTSFQPISDVSVGGERIHLSPDPSRLQADILDVFLKRRSSFGRMDGSRALSQADVSLLLASGAAARRIRADTRQANGEPSLTRLMVFVNNVEGLQRGVYAFDAENNALQQVQSGDFRLFLQQHYFLQNYNLALTGAVIAVVGRMEDALERYGNRGYRLMNHEVGMVVQSLYLVATALSLEGGATLGIDNNAVNEICGLTDSGQEVLIHFLLGASYPVTANFDARLR
jgi:SagB-type dehydrogenase family enzyme